MIKCDILSQKEGKRMKKKIFLILNVVISCLIMAFL